MVRPGAGKGAVASQVNVDRPCRTTTFIDRPNNQRLASTAVTSREHTRDGSRELAMLRLVVGTRIQFQSEDLTDIVLRPRKPIARSTKSAPMISSLPGTSSIVNLPSFFTH